MARGLLRRAPRLLLIAGVADAREIALPLIVDGARLIAALDRRSAEIDEDDWRGAAEVRGLFAGAEGLMTALKWDRIEAVIDASHPFDLETSEAAQIACRALAMPLYHYARPPWRPGPQEQWREVPDVAAAADALPLLSRVYLGFDYTPLEPFRGRLNTWFLARRFRPTGQRLPLKRGDWVVAPRRLTEAHERILFQDRRIGWVALENAGGGPGAASLAAARTLDLKILTLDPPLLGPAPVLGGRFEEVAALREAVAARF